MNQAEQAAGTREWLTQVLPDTAAEFVDKCYERTMSAGAEYYDPINNQMKFETMKVEDLFTYIQEELLDTINYCWMISERCDDADSQHQIAQVAVNVAKTFKDFRRLRKNWRISVAIKRAYDEDRHSRPQRQPVSDYSSAHRIAVDILMPAPCSKCDAPFSRGGQNRALVHVALRHDTPSNFLRRDGRGMYSIRPEDYLPLCASCHVNYDRGHSWPVELDQTP